MIITTREPGEATTITVRMNQFTLSYPPPRALASQFRDCVIGRVVVLNRHMQSGVVCVESMTSMHCAGAGFILCCSF